MNDPITPAQMSSYVHDHQHDGVVELKTIIGHEKLEISLGIQGFTKQQQDWLKDVIPRQIKQAYDHGFIEARHQVRKRLQEAIGTQK